jgi:DNA-binding CsgD family transcriptional regulator
VVTRRPPLLGRAAECAALERMLRNVRGGQSGVLVIRGEAGMGKTALLRECVSLAAGFHVVRLTIVEAEMELPFAAVHQLCAPILDGLDALPQPQRDALSVALGVASGSPPDRFLVAVSVLSLLAAAAEDRPVLCVIDDAQWLDSASAQVLGFVARRLLAESVVIVFAVREPVGRVELEGLPELALGGLDEEVARRLLATAVPGRLDDRVRDRIIGETRGNPLALLELSRGKSEPQLAGGFGVPGDTDLRGHLEDQYLRRVRALPAATQRLLLLAAAEPAGDAPLLWRAARRLGVSASDLAPAQDAELLQVGADVRFRHPLVRSAVYRSASPERRRRVHGALAEASDPEVDADRRAWHRALAAVGEDEDLAAELERSAQRAQMRGGFAAAATLLERATDLTPDPRRRAQRALGAAEAKHLSGDARAAPRLLGQAEAGPLEELERARVQILRGRAAFGSSRGADAPPLLLAAARGLEPLDPMAARDTYLDALSAALFVGRLSGATGVLEVARAARAAPAHSARPQDLLLDGLAALITDGYVAGGPLVQRAVAAFRNGEMPVPDAIRWLWLATHAAHDVWDDEGWQVLCERHVALARQSGALAVLPIALSARVGLHLFAGELSQAASLNDELAAVTDAMGAGFPPYAGIALAAFRGREDDAAPLIAAVRAQVRSRGDGMGLTLIEHATAVLYNGLGRYRDACAAAQRGAEHPRELGFSAWSLVQLVEAAVRSDQPALAHDAIERLVQTTRPSGGDWALGVEARSRALVSEGDGAEALYREAIDRLGRTRLRAEHARAHLVYGEWLRRHNRRVDSREHLRTAHNMFADMGMEAFAERGRRELLATGETVRRRQGEHRDELTPQEDQIARLAGDGLTNTEIGGQLFLSPRTVEWHLRKVFGKLGINGRTELNTALSYGGGGDTLVVG